MPGTVVAVIATTPCNDFSKLLDLPHEDGKPPVRPCLDGEQGKKTLQLGEIHKWIKKDHQPFHLYENVDFSDHPHFKIVTKMLGGYEIINSLDHAYLNRKRVYFKNFDIPAEIKSKYPSLRSQANNMLDIGRKINTDHGPPTLTASFRWKTKEDLQREHGIEPDAIPYKNREIISSKLKAYLDYSSTKPIASGMSI